MAGPRRLLFLPGQIGTDGKGVLAAGFAAQCRLAWRNLAAALAGSGMTLADVVAVRTVLADRGFALTSDALRTEVLGKRRIASTLTIAALSAEGALVELIAVAARS